MEGEVFKERWGHQLYHHLLINKFKNVSYLLQN